MICPAATGTNFSAGTSGLSAFSRFSRGTSLVNLRAEPRSVNLNHCTALWCQLAFCAGLPVGAASGRRSLPSCHVTAITDKPALEE